MSYKWSNTVDDTGHLIPNTWCHQSIYRYYPSQIPVHVKCKKEMGFTNNTSLPHDVGCLTPNAIKWHTSSAMAFIFSVLRNASDMLIHYILMSATQHGLRCMLCGLWPMISYKQFSRSHCLALIRQTHRVQTYDPQTTG